LFFKKLKYNNRKSVETLVLLLGQHREDVRYLVIMVNSLILVGNTVLAAWMTVNSIYFDQCPGAPNLLYISLVTSVTALVSNILYNLYSDNKYLKWMIRCFYVFLFSLKVCGVVAIFYYQSAYRSGQIDCQPVVFWFAFVIFIFFLVTMCLLMLCSYCILSSYLLNHRKNEPLNV